MFESLKKKLSSWLGKPEKKEEKKSKKKQAISKKAKKKSKGKVTSVIDNENAAEEIIEEVIIQGKNEAEPAEQIIEESSEEKIEEEKKEVEKELEEPQGALRKEGLFAKLFRKFQSAKISQENFEEIFSELEIILLENNVALEVVEKIKNDLAPSLIGAEIKRNEIGRKIMESLKSSILDVLIEPPNLIEQINSKKESPYVILFFGINGSGKTTSIAKLAYKLKKHNISCVMAAADTFRAASIEQLKAHGEKINIDVIAKDYGADPAAVAFDAIQYAKKNHIRVVLIDTAGRMYTKSNLMKEMEKIVRVSSPDLKIFVGESITGNDATEQTKTFNETAGIDGIILSKADVDEKAGTILSVSYVTKKPIYYLGTGQDYDDLKDFKKSEVLEHLGL
jgi:fused signal recognition particle receptor